MQDDRRVGFRVLCSSRPDSVTEGTDIEIEVTRTGFPRRYVVKWFASAAQPAQLVVPNGTDAVEC